MKTKNGLLNQTCPYCVFVNYQNSSLEFFFDIQRKQKQEKKKAKPVTDTPEATHCPLHHWQLKGLS